MINNLNKPVPLPSLPGYVATKDARNVYIQKQDEDVVRVIPLKARIGCTALFQNRQRTAVEAMLWDMGKRC